jgi:trigger factor
VSVAAGDVTAATEKVARNYATVARVPGFRKGKAPPAMVRKKYATEIQQEAVETLLREAYQAVVEQEKLKLATQPHAHDVKFAEGGPLTFELHCEVRPEITLERVHGFTVTRPRATVTDEMVDEQIDQLRESRATWAPVTERAVEGDLVTASLATTEADGTIGEPKEYRIELGKGQAIAGVEELILSCAPGETTEQPVRWPDDFPDQEQAGKIKTVRVTVQDVKRKTLPVLDDAFAGELGDFDSLDAMRTAVREDLASQAEREADAAARGRLVDEILSANPFPVPPSWVNRLLGIYIETYKIPESDHQTFAKEFGPTAERQVRRDMVVEALAEREKLAATEKDLDERIASLAEKRGTQPGTLYASLEKAGRLSELERGITEERVFAWLFEQNTIVQED